MRDVRCTKISTTPYSIFAQAKRLRYTPGAGKNTFTCDDKVCCIQIRRAVFCARAVVSLLHNESGQIKNISKRCHQILL